MNLDDELRAALRPENPPAGFAGRVVARARLQPKPRSSMPRMIWAAALAATVVIGFTGVFEYREMQAERAASQAVVALRIAAEKLNMTRDKVQNREN